MLKPLSNVTSWINTLINWKGQHLVSHPDEVEKVISKNKSITLQSDQIIFTVIEWIHGQCEL